MGWASKIFVAGFLVVGGICASEIVAQARPAATRENPLTETAVKAGASNGKQGQSQTGFSPGGAQIALDELAELRTRLAALEGKKGNDPRTISELKDRMSELDMRLREWIVESKDRDSAAEDLRYFSGETLALATTWIHWVAILFTVIALAIGLGNFVESRRMQKDLDRDRAQLKDEIATAKDELSRKGEVLQVEVAAALDRISKTRDKSATEMAAFRTEVDEQRLSTRRTRKFVQAVGGYFFTEALLQLLGVLHKGGALDDAGYEELRNKTKEIEARLFLRDPDLTRAEPAIHTLIALGGDDALADLVEFAGASALAPDLRSLAQQAIIRISEKRGAAAGGGSRKRKV